MSLWSRRETPGPRRTTPGWWHWLGLAALLVIGSASSAMGQDAPKRALAAEGEGIALQWCAACHAIGSGADGAVLGDAPSFVTLAEEPYLDGPTLLRLRRTPHPFMPTFPLTERSAAALAAYIGSVRVGPDGAPQQ